MSERYTQYPRSTLWLVEEDEFTMGDGAGDRAPSFRIDVRSFYLGKSVITNEEYEAFAPEHERHELSSGDEEPVTNVSFREALAYCDWYARLSKKPFRLPTEVEWEFACRSDTTTRWFFGDEPAGFERCAWLAESSGGRAHPIEGLKANPFGLHDMLGGVWEWTSSLHRPYPVEDGDGRDDLEARGHRVLRGGSFRTPVAETGSAVRRAAGEDERFPDVGFRIARLL